MLLLLISYEQVTQILEMFDAVKKVSNLNVGLLILSIHVSWHLVSITTKDPPLKEPPKVSVHRVT